MYEIKHQQDEQIKTIIELQKINRSKKPLYLEEQKRIIINESNESKSKINVDLNSARQVLSPKLKLTNKSSIKFKLSLEISKNSDKHPIKASSSLAQRISSAMGENKMVLSPDKECKNRLNTENTTSINSKLNTTHTERMKRQSKINLSYLFLQGTDYRRKLDNLICSTTERELNGENHCKNEIEPQLPKRKKMKKFFVSNKNDNITKTPTKSINYNQTVSFLKTSEKVQLEEKKPKKIWFNIKRHALPRTLLSKIEKANSYNKRNVVYKRKTNKWVFKYDDKIDPFLKSNTDIYDTIKKTSSAVNVNKNYDSGNFEIPMCYLITETKNNITDCK